MDAYGTALSYPWSWPGRVRAWPGSVTSYGHPMRMVQILRAPGILLGVGLGGFVDGILLHQLLQWHHMLTSTDSDRIGVRFYPADTVAGLRMNTLWDGLFHVVTWLFVLSGLALLYGRLTSDPRR